MNSQIMEATPDYNFTNLSLANPIQNSGGYFTRLFNELGKNVYIQTPKCLTKNGFIKSANGKKVYVDLMFTNEDSIFIQWMESLEEKCQELLHDKGSTWFQVPLDKNDIETAFTSCMKLYRSGKYYIIRVNVNPNICIYDESSNKLPFESITTENIVCILEMAGVRFTQKNFQLEIEMKQGLIVSPDPFMDTCYIQRTTTSTSSTPLTPPSIINTKMSTELQQQQQQQQQSYVDMDVKEIVKNTKVSNSAGVGSGSGSGAVLLKDNENLGLFKEPSLEILMAGEKPSAVNVNMGSSTVKVDSKGGDKVDNIDGIEECGDDFPVEEEQPVMNLKSSVQVYHDIYVKAKEKWLDAVKKVEMATIEMEQAKVELEHIKNKYDIDDEFDEEDEEDEDGDENEEDSDEEIEVDDDLSGL